MLLKSNYKPHNVDGLKGKIVDQTGARAYFFLEIKLPVHRDLVEDGNDLRTQFFGVVRKWGWSHWDEFPW